MPDIGDSDHDNDNDEEDSEDGGEMRRTAKTGARMTIRRKLVPVRPWKRE